MLRFLACGDWSAGHVTTTWTADGRRRVPAVEAAIDAAWAAASARPGVRLFDGPMCRLESWDANPQRLRLALSPTSYRPFLGTNMANPGLADEYGADVMANPVGVSAALVTADGFVLLGRRNGSVAYYPNRIHPFAGCLEPGDADVFAAVRRELSEELSIADADLNELRCTGIVEEIALRQRELIFVAVSSLDRQSIESRLDPTEHAAVWQCPATPAGVAAAVESQHGELTPVGVASLLLWGRLRFGDAWFDQCRATVTVAE